LGICWVFWRPHLDYLPALGTSPGKVTSLEPETRGMHGLGLCPLPLGSGWLQIPSPLPSGVHRTSGTLLLSVSEKQTGIPISMCLFLFLISGKTGNLKSQCQFTSKQTRHCFASELCRAVFCDFAKDGRPGMSISASTVLPGSPRRLVPGKESQAASLLLTGKLELGRG
jgi:hypothetical protein